MRFCPRVNCRSPTLVGRTGVALPAVRAEGEVAMRGEEAAVASVLELLSMQSGVVKAHTVSSRGDLEAVAREEDASQMEKGVIDQSWGV